MSVVMSSDSKSIFSNCENITTRKDIKKLEDIISILEERINYDTKAYVDDESEEIRLLNFISPFIDNNIITVPHDRKNLKRCELLVASEDLLEEFYCNIDIIREFLDYLKLVRKRIEVFNSITLEEIRNRGRRNEENKRLFNKINKGIELAIKPYLKMVYTKITLDLQYKNLLEFKRLTCKDAKHIEEVIKNSKKMIR